VYSSVILLLTAADVRDECEAWESRRRLGREEAVGAAHDGSHPVNAEVLLEPRGLCALGLALAGRPRGELT